ncbi:MAG TPA: hypothetical protein V6D23_15210, partial [Candidatus Obscuribacterales bacterium]
DKGFSIEQYSDTMQARNQWLEQKREATVNRDRFNSGDVDQILQLLDKNPRLELNPAGLRAIVADDRHYTLPQREAARKLLENENLFDYVWSFSRGDAVHNDTHAAGGDGVMDLRLHPEPANRAHSSLSRENLAGFREILANSVIQSPNGRDHGVVISDFHDGREAAGKLFAAAKVKGDDGVLNRYILSYLCEGAGSDERSMIDTLKNSADTRGKVIALQRDYERLYHEPLRSMLLDELGGGDKGEALAYAEGPDQQSLASQEIRTAERARYFLAEFKPRIDEIGADNGPLAWTVGHSEEDTRRKADAVTHYATAEDLLKQIDALKAQQNPPADPAQLRALENQLVGVTAQIMQELQADRRADTGYTESKNAAVTGIKNGAVVVAATAVTVLTAGAGAPLLVAAAAGTVAGTTVAFYGSVAEQTANHIGDWNRNRIDVRMTEKQLALLADMSPADKKSYSEIWEALIKNINHHYQRQTELGQLSNVIDPEKLMSDTWEGFKTASVTSLTTALTFGLNNLVKTTQLAAAVQELGTLGKLGSQAVINGITGVTGDAAGQMLAPLHVKTGWTADNAQQAIQKLRDHQGVLQKQQQGYQTQKQASQLLVQAFEGRYRTTPATGGTPQLVETQAPTEAELQAYFRAKMFLQEADGLIAELNDSIKALGTDITKLNNARASLNPLEWNDAEWAEIKQHLGRSLAISFVAGATLNLVNPEKFAIARILTNAASGATEAIARNLIEKHIDGKADKDIFDGVLQSMLTSVVAGEAAHLANGGYTQALDGLDQTVQGKTYRELSAADQQLLHEHGFDPAKPETHEPAFRKLIEAHPRGSDVYQRLVTGSEAATQKLLSETAQRIRETVGSADPQANPDLTATRYLEGHERLAQMANEKAKLLEHPGFSDNVQKLANLEIQREVLLQKLSDLSNGRASYGNDGQFRSAQDIQNGHEPTPHPMPALDPIPAGQGIHPTERPTGPDPALQPIPDAQREAIRGKLANGESLSPTEGLLLVQDTVAAARQTLIDASTHRYENGSQHAANAQEAMTGAKLSLQCGFGTSATYHRLIEMGIRPDQIQVHQAAELFGNHVGDKASPAPWANGWDQHAFLTIKLDNGKSYLIDNTFRQFFDNNSSGKPGEFLRGSVEGQQLADQLLHHGYVELNDKTAALYAAAFRHGETQDGLGHPLPVRDADSFTRESSMDPTH